MAYEKCSEVNREFWVELAGLAPGEGAGRTAAVFREGRYHLPFLDRELNIGPGARPIQVAGAPGDAAVAFQVFPGLEEGVILWQGDEDFPPQITFTVPAHLDLFLESGCGLGTTEPGDPGDAKGRFAQLNYGLLRILKNKKLGTSK